MINACTGEITNSYDYDYDYDIGIACIFIYLFISLFIHSINKCLLIACFMPGTELGRG